MRSPHTSNLLSIPLFVLVAAVTGSAVAAQDMDAPAVVVDAEQVIDMVNTVPELLIIDSRLVTDRKRGFIQGSIPLTDTDTTCQSLARIAPNKNKALVFYCNGPKCRRSKNAITIAKSCGYGQLYWFKGGFEEWLQKKYVYNKNE